MSAIFQTSFLIKTEGEREVTVPRVGLPGSSGVKDLPEIQEMQFRPLSREDPLEKEMVTHA